VGVRLGSCQSPAFQLEVDSNEISESPSIRGASIPGYPSLTVGYPTELQKGGIDIPPGVKMLGYQLAQTVCSWLLA
jgi:hypothetical protein